jgi:drug/metabolite transporter (DMT)-like permease
VLAIIGGLGAAVMWATTTICSSRSSRTIPASSVLAWVMVVGLVVTLPALVATGVPAARVDLGILAWLAVAGIGNVLGLLLEYAGLSIGKVGVVAPIASTEGAIAAIIAVTAGETLSTGATAMLAVIAVGVILAGLVTDPVSDELVVGDSPWVPSSGRGRRSRAALLAVGAAVAFGVSLYAAGRVSLDLPVAWVLLPPRLVGVVAIAIPLALTSRLRFSREVAPLLVVSGVAEVIGFVSFVVGARHGIAIAAVLGSQFAALAAIAAFLFFGERLRRVQIAGVGAIAVGVAALSILRA